jgi:hypothetical protein
MLLSLTQGFSYMPEENTDSIEIIVVTKRDSKNGDYHAHTKSNPLLWDCGLTPAQAVINLLRSHPEHFDQFFRLQIDN